MTLTRAQIQQEIEAMEARGTTQEEIQQWIDSLSAPPPASKAKYIINIMRKYGFTTFIFVFYGSLLACVVWLGVKLWNEGGSSLFTDSTKSQFQRVGQTNLIEAGHTNEVKAKVSDALVMATNIITNLVGASNTPSAVTEPQKKIPSPEQQPIVNDTSNHGLNIRTDHNGVVFQNITITQDSGASKKGASKLDIEVNTRTKLDGDTGPSGKPDNEINLLDSDFTIEKKGDPAVTRFMYIEPGNGTLYTPPQDVWIKLWVYEDSGRYTVWMNLGNKEEPKWRTAPLDWEVLSGARARVSGYWIQMKKGSPSKKVRIQFEKLGQQTQPH